MMAALAGSRLASILPTLLALSFARSAGTVSRTRAIRTACKAAVACLRRERGHAGRLDLPVQRRVEVPEGLVVRAVPGSRRVEHGDHQPGVSAADPARGLDVLGGRLRLAHHGHEAEPVDVDADGDHVGREDDIEGLRIWMPDIHPAQVVGDVTRWLPAGQLDAMLDLPPVACVPAAEELEAVIDVVLDLHPGTAEDAQAVEVADQGPVRVLDRGRAVEFRHGLQERGVGADQQGGLAGAGAMTPTYRRVPFSAGGPRRRRTSQSR